MGNAVITGFLRQLPVLYRFQKLKNNCTRLREYTGDATPSWIAIINCTASEFLPKFQGIGMRRVPAGKLQARILLLLSVNPQFKKVSEAFTIPQYICNLKDFHNFMFCN